MRDTRDISTMLESLRRYVDGRENVRLLVDLSNVEYLSSCAIGTLLGILKACKRGNGVLKLCRPNDSLCELFTILRLHQIIEVFRDRKHALMSRWACQDEAAQASSRPTA